MMRTYQKILLSLAILSLCALFLLIIFGDNGLVDLHRVKREKALIVKKNEKLKQENMEKYREIHRLENDLSYIEEVARKELGMVKGDEVIIKPERQ